MTLAGTRPPTVDDGDVTGIVQTVSRSHYSNVRFVLKNDELKNIFDRVNIAQTQGLDLYVDSKYAYVNTIYLTYDSDITYKEMFCL